MTNSPLFPILIQFILSLQYVFNQHLWFCAIRTCRSHTVHMNLIVMERKTIENLLQSVRWKSNAMAMTTTLKVLSCDSVQCFCNLKELRSSAFLQQSMSDEDTITHRWKREYQKENSIYHETESVLYTQ